jgi:hypothetical protein
MQGNKILPQGDTFHFPLRTTKKAGQMTLTEHDCYAGGLFRHMLALPVARLWSKEKNYTYIPA